MADWLYITGDKRDLHALILVTLSDTKVDTSALHTVSHVLAGIQSSVIVIRCVLCLLMNAVMSSDCQLSINCFHIKIHVLLFTYTIIPPAYKLSSTHLSSCSPTG